MDRALVFNCPCQLARLKYQRKYEGGSRRWRRGWLCRRGVGRRPPAMRRTGETRTKCAVQLSGALVWKYDVIPHLWETTKSVHLVPSGAKCQAWP